jgi:hypothetical protein
MAFSKSVSLNAREPVTAKGMSNGPTIWQPSDDACGLMEQYAADFFGRGLSESTRRLCLELATDFRQSDNASVLKIVKQCDLATRSVRQA